MMPPVSLPLKGGTRIGPRRRAHQHSAHRNQARRPNHSHRRLHFAATHLRAHPLAMERTAGASARSYRQVLPPCT